MLIVGISIFSAIFSLFLRITLLIMMAWCKTFLNAGSKNEYMKKFTLELMMIKSWLTGTSTENQNLKPSLHPFSLMSRYRVSPRNSSMFNKILNAWQSINTITIQNRINVFFTSLSLLWLSLPAKTFSGFVVSGQGTKNKIYFPYLTEKIFDIS